MNPTGICPANWRQLKITYSPPGTFRRVILSVGPLDWSAQTLRRGAFADERSAHFENNNNRQHVIKMYPAHFNLRHFMSHLAPGGYYLLYIVLLAFLVLWLVFPASIEKSIPSVNAPISGLLTVSFATFVVIGYFVGVVLRLPSVDAIDAVSVDYNLRRKLRSESECWLIRHLLEFRDLAVSIGGRELPRNAVRHETQLESPPTTFREFVRSVAARSLLNAAAQSHDE